MENNKVWFVTGASKGLGLSLVKKLLSQGQRVAATSRNIDELKEAVDYNGEEFLPLGVNLTSELSVENAIQSTIDTFGRIDVIVNNAGYGIGGSIEELTDAETRKSFEVNVYAMFYVIRKALPQLRKQQSGHIINISSIAGFTANTGWSVYAATKYAIVGFSEVLAEDVKSFGIKVTVVAPGAFRTSFLTSDSLALAENTMEEYVAVRASHQKYLQMNGQQAGDPDKAADAMVQIAGLPQPPLYLLLGEDAFERANNKLSLLEKEFKKWEDLTKSTGFSK